MPILDARYLVLVLYCIYIIHLRMVLKKKPGTAPAEYKVERRERCFVCKEIPTNYDSCSSTVSTSVPPGKQPQTGGRRLKIKVVVEKVREATKYQRKESYEFCHKVTCCRQGCILNRNVRSAHPGVKMKDEDRDSIICSGV